jgi:hypothetical protein
MPPRRSARCPFVFAVAGFALLACRSPQSLPPAQSANTVDTVTLYALSGTPFTTPSAYALPGPQVVRTDQTTAFDFAFNIDSLGQAVLVPAGALGLPKDAGLLKSGSAFDGITIALTDGYVLDKPLVVSVGTVAFARSRVQTCLDGSKVSLYAKLRVLALDPGARTIKFQILVNLNCGYLGLAPGIPSQ